VLTPDEARRLAGKTLADVAHGLDPAEARQADRQALTMAELCREYLERADAGLIISRRGRAKKASTLKIDEARIARHIVPLLGRRPIKDITQADIRAFQRDITVGKTAADVRTKPRGRATLAHPFDYLLGQRLARRNFADRARDLRAVEGRERDHTVVWAQAPGRAELSARRRDDEERRLGAALSERAHEVERGRVGPVQVLESKRGGLRARAGQNPGDERRQLPAPQFFGCEFRHAAVGQIAMGTRNLRRDLNLLIKRCGISM
jgi:hypothetical protein